MDYLEINHLFEDYGVYITLLASVITWFIFKSWIAGGWCYSTERLDGKTVIITGSNTGIGKETARELSKRGARVILACRDLQKATRAATEIEAETHGEISVKHLDLVSFKSIHKFAKEILATEPRINILINNAGLMTVKGKTEDGFDLVFGTNHLGHFLLTNLLLPKIKESVPARIINVSSMVYLTGKMHWDDLNFDKPGNYGTFKAYCQSKLANIYFTQELARRLKDTGVTAYALHPGVVASEFSRYFPEYCPTWLKYPYMLFQFMTTILCKTPVQGAQTSIYCAVSEEVKNDSGLYYSDCKIQELKPFAKSYEAAKTLWELSVEMVKLEDN